MAIVRRIRDNIHGTIAISELEDCVISHKYMQRLRRIKQLAFLQYVFPGASHSRFEHSMGVLHLANVAWKQLYENQLSIRGSSKKYRDFSEQEARKPDSESAHFGVLAPTFDLIDDVFKDEYTAQALRLAALMHDIGHSPFSHSGEMFMPTWGDFYKKRAAYAVYLQTYISHIHEELKGKGRDPDSVQVRHELYTLLMIDQVLTDIYSNPRYKGIKINPQDVAAIVAPFISPVEGSPLDKHGAHMLCHELVSGELDVDRMDYLLRDSRECGVVYGIFDESRILNSLAVYWDIEQKELHLAIQFSGLAAFEDYLRARHSMYLQLYFHKTSVAAEAMIQNLAKLIENCKLPTNIENYASIDETNFNSYILKLAADQNLDTARQTELRMLLDDLLLNRKLWKRVFEVASNIGPGDGATSIDRAATTIASLGFQFEKVSSSSSLTRFRPRSSDADPRAAALRLIKKDYMQFPRVIPIEDQLSLVDANSHVHITRLYVENRFDTKTDRPIADLVREALHVL